MMGAASHNTSWRESDAMNNQLVDSAVTECALHSMLMAMTVDSPGATSEAQRLEFGYVKLRAQSKLPWIPTKTLRTINTSIGRCDVAFKASPSTDEKVIKYSGLLKEAFACRISTSDDLPDAPDTLDEMSLMFGRRGDMMAEAFQIHELFRRCCSDNAKLHKLIKKHNLFDDDPVKEDAKDPAKYPQVIPGLSINVETNVMNLRKNLKERADHLDPNVHGEFCRTMMSSYHRSTSALRLLKRFERAVEEHVEARVRSGKCFMAVDYLGEDIIVNIAEIAGFKATSSLMGAHRDFYNCENLKKLRPHIRIREVAGQFPQRIDQVPGIGMVPVVCKSNAVPIVVDLAYVGASLGRNHPTTRKHTRGWGWIARDGGHVPLDQRKGFNHDMMEITNRDFKEEPVAEGRFLVRLDATTFFENELVCQVELVYADTHQPVDDSVYESLKVSRSCLRNMDCLSTYTSKDQVPYPAYFKCIPMRLTTDDQNRTYKFKVTATGMVKASAGRERYEQTLVTFSRAFASVSTKRPLKRKLANPK